MSIRNARSLAILVGTLLLGASSAVGPRAQQPPPRTTLPIVPPPTGWLLGTVGGPNTTKGGSGWPTSI